MSKFTGNIIRLPAVTPTQNSASGVYTLDDQFTAQSSGTWPIVRDQYFNYTTLLLTGAVQGTAYPNPVTQPYSFLSDASTNNFVVSPNGDVSARPFNPYLNNYSNSFNGTSDYLSIADNAAFNFGTGDATVEFWFNSPGTTNNYPGIVSAVNYAATGVASIRFDNTGYKGKVFMYLNGGGDPVIASTSIVPYNTWTHVAIVRQGTSLKLYLNGSLDASVTISSSLGWYLSNGGMRIGRGFDVDGAGGYYPGYLTNLRLVKGTAVYTAPFVPSTIPLQNITNTSLLTCQSNRFRDNGTANSGSGFTITPSGSPVVSQNSPFVSYDTTNGSGYFDGNDWLSAPDSSAYTMGTGDFTVEAWVYCTATDFASSRYIIAQRNSSADTSISFAMNFIGGGTRKVRLLCFDSGGASYEAVCATDVLNLNEWTHIAGVRNGATLRIYVNGVQQGTANISTASLVDSDGGVGIGRLGDANFYYWLGYISNVRVTKGGCLYPSGTQFTPPTAPLTTTVSAGTVSLLTLQTRAPATNNGFIDSSPNNFVVTRNGNTTQGSFSPFSPTGWSYYLADQQNNTVNFTTSAGTDFQFSGDFTIEGWVYAQNSSGDGSLFVVSDNTNYLALNISISANVFNIYLNGGTPAAVITSDIPVAAWTHVAMVRNGSGTGNIKLYVNGGLKGSATNTSTLGFANPAVARIGGGVSGINRYYSNVRVCKSAVYTAAFTPSTLPLSTTSQSATNCVLLTANANRFLNQTAGATATITGSPSVQAFSPFAPAQSYIPSQIGGSGYFDGSDSLQVPSNPLFNYSSTDMTVELWLYLLTIPAEGAILELGTGATTGDIQLIVVSSAGGISFGTSGRAKTWIAVAANQWYHIAGVKSGSTYYLYVNGTRYTTESGSSTSSSTTVNIGSRNSTTNYLTGYMSNYKISNYARYNTTTIPVPTTPAVSDANTSLLLNFTNGGIVDATGKNNLETVANSGVQTSIINPFGSRTGLMYFNGSSYFYEPYTQLMNQLSGSFTIECWIYPTATSTRMIFAGSISAAGSENWSWEITSANKLSYTFSIGGSSVTATSTASISQNTWTYVAVVRSGGTLTQYINGSSDGTASPTAGAYRNASFGFAIGRGGDYNSLYFTGYVDEFRMTIGQARTITASPTGPFPLG